MDKLLPTVANPADDFIASVERQALRMAELATKNPVDAMDILDAGVRKWVQKHGKSPRVDWQKSFYTVLEQAINDFLRRQMPVLQWFSSRSEIQFWQELGSSSIDMSAEKAELHKAILVALAHLPLPQQQTFLLCGWLGFTVEDVAAILAEPVATIASRYASASVGIKDALGDIASQQNNPADEHWLVRVCQALDESAANVSYVQQHQLREIRRHTVNRQPSRSFIQWFLLTGVMALCLFVFWSLQVPKPVDSQQKQVIPQQNPYVDALQPWREEPGLLENLPFFVWLAMQADGVLADEQALAETMTEKQLYSRWERLPADRTAFLRGQYQSFSYLTSDMQQAVRSHYQAFKRLTVNQQYDLQLQWQALDVGQKAAVMQQLSDSGNN